MNISLIIPVHSGIDRINYLFDSLSALQLGHLRAECVFVVDRCDPVRVGETRKKCRLAKPGRWQRWEVVASDFGNPDQARDLGIKIASGRVIAFLDDDCRPFPEWLMAGWSHSQTHSAVTGPVHHDPGIWGSLVAVMDFGQFQSDKPASINNFPGCNVFFAARILASYPVVSACAYGGDRLLSHHVCKGKKSIRYCPDVAVCHCPPLDFFSIWAREIRYGQVAWAVRKNDPSIPWGKLVKYGIAGACAMAAGRLFIDLKRTWASAVFRRRFFMIFFLVVVFRIPYLTGVIKAYAAGRAS